MSETEDLQTVAAGLQTDGSAAVDYDSIYFCKSSGSTAYLRFYPDGTVIRVSSEGEPKKVIKWFNRENSDIENKGAFKIAQGKISCTTNADHSQSIDHNGTVYPDKLVLSSYSNINGNKRDNLEFLLYTEKKKAAAYSGRNEGK